VKDSGPEHGEAETGTGHTSILADPTKKTPSAQGRTRTSAGHKADAELQQEMERISLAQALAETETANARVIDLTQRLVEAGQQVAVLRAELERLRLEHVQLRTTHEQMRSSSAFRIAERIWAVRNALGV